MSLSEENIRPFLESLVHLKQLHMERHRLYLKYFEQLLCWSVAQLHGVNQDDVESWGLDEGLFPRFYRQERRSTCLRKYLDWPIRVNYCKLKDGKIVFFEKLLQRKPRKVAQDLQPHYLIDHDETHYETRELATAAIWTRVFGVEGVFE